MDVNPSLSLASERFKDMDVGATLEAREQRLRNFEKYKQHEIKVQRNREKRRQNMRRSKASDSSFLISDNDVRRPSTVSQPPLLPRTATDDNPLALSKPYSKAHPGIQVQDLDNHESDILLHNRRAKRAVHYEHSFGRTDRTNEHEGESDLLGGRPRKEARRKDYPKRREN